MNRITAKLADVATISFAGSRMTPGFGSIEQHAAEIEREDFRSIDFSTDRKSTRLNSSHLKLSRMPSSA